MTDLNRRAGELGEYGDAANEGGAPVDPDAGDGDDAPESTETDEDAAPGPSHPVAPAVLPADQGGTRE